MSWAAYHADWSTEDALRLASDSVLTACILAASERLAGVNLNTNGAYGGYQRPAFLTSRILAWGWVVSVMERVVTEYSKHTDSSGDWNGQASLPAWDQSSIAAAAGVSWPSIPTELSELSASIPYACYKILNLMRWRVYTSASRSRTSDRLYTSYISFVDAESNFNSTSWRAESFPTGGVSYHFAQYIGGPSPNWMIRRQRERFASNTAFRPNFSTSYMLDIYRLMMGPGNTIANYENNDYPVNVSTYAKVHTGTSVSTPGFYDFEVYIGNFGDSTVSDPTATIYSGWYSVYQNTICIAKYDVTGGFDFVAP